MSHLKDKSAIDIRITEVSLALVRKCFEDEAFQTVQYYKSWFSKKGVRICPSCEKPVDLASVKCSKCLKCYHILCLNISDPNSTGRPSDVQFRSNSCTNVHGRPMDVRRTSGFGHTFRFN